MNDGFDNDRKEEDIVKGGSQVHNDLGDDSFRDSPEDKHTPLEPLRINNSSTIEEPNHDEKAHFKHTANILFEKTETDDDLLQELDSLVGLVRVKEEIRRLLQYVKVQGLRREQGISESRMSLHSVFLGSPGTGKTTVARIYGRMLKSMGILSKGHLVETDRAGLVASYVGQTAIKTDEKVMEALGGILFIDEAYSLSQEDQASSDFGSESIQILMKRMEDHRDDLIVIVAGYPDPMKSFLRSNEGFKSRFSTYINFADFTAEEMLEIFKYFCEKENYDIAPNAMAAVLTAIDFKYSIRDKTFGNARYVRNFFEYVIRNHASRVGSSISEPSAMDLRLLKAEDIPLTIADGG